MSFKKTRKKLKIFFVVHKVNTLCNMKSGHVVISIISIFFFLLISSQLASAKAIDVYDIEITLDDAGNAQIKTMVLFDSSAIKNLRLSAHKPDNLQAYDLTGSLNHIVVNNSVMIKPREEVKDYNTTVKYATNQISSKTGDEWNISYNVLAYDSIEYLSISLSLPSGSSLKSFTLGGSASVIDSGIKIEWYIDDVPSNENVNLGVIYAMKIPAHDEHGSTLIILAVSIVLAGMASFVMYNKSKKREKDEAKMETEETPKDKIKPEAELAEELVLTQGKKDIMMTLNKNEQDVVKELLREEGKLTQKDIFTEIGLPRSTLSRTLKKLERKNVVEIRSIGNTNLVILTEWFKER